MCRSIHTLYIFDLQTVLQVGRWIHNGALVKKTSKTTFNTDQPLGKMGLGKNLLLSLLKFSEIAQFADFAQFADTV